MAELGSLARRHLLDLRVHERCRGEAALARSRATVGDAYRANVALGLGDERRRRQAMLERAGVIVIDVPASKLTTALIDEYLRVKRRGLL